MSRLKTALIVVLALLAGVSLAIAALILARTFETDNSQAKLTDFYTPPTQFDATPGTLIRYEPLGVDVPGAISYRILYVTTDHNDQPAVASGMAFVPTTPSEDTPRKIIAWTHGTTGQGDACAPSRSANPTSQLIEFLPGAISADWVVTAPDYLGLGTPGIQQYLLKGQEVRDTVNSVRAAQALPDARVGNDYAVFGHSQGGHTALWTGHLGQEFAPELNLVAVAAAAPAAELQSIIDKQWKTVIGWVIGSEVMRSWPISYPELPVESLISRPAALNYNRMAQECITDAALEGQIRQGIFNEDFFLRNPVTDPRWAQALQDQTPPPLPAELPLMLIQGTADQVVLAEPNAQLQQDWCAAGSTINALWLGGVDHMKAAQVAGPSVVSWLNEIFDGKTPPNTCSIPPPWSALTLK